MSQIRSLLSKVRRRFLNESTPEKKYTIQTTFLSSHYQNHNIRRLAHLDSLDLDLKEKKVLELGAGIGDHTYYFLIKNSIVVPTEGRPELVKEISTRFGLNAVELDLERDLFKLNSLGTFDYVYCYGLLYHLKNPEQVLSAISKVAQILLLETAVSSDQSSYGPNIVNEVATSPTQAISGFGCRPNRRWLYDELKKQYPYVYLPFSQPVHSEFPKDWRNLKPDNLHAYQYKRAIFLASMHPIDNNNLTLEYLYEFR